MVAEFSAEEVLEITEGRLALGMMHDSAGPIVIDTRTMNEGSWFLALEGTHFDGHDFIGDAFAAGAAGCIVDERPNYAIANTNFPLIAVADTREALRALARNWRKRIGPKVLLVIGEPYRDAHDVSALCKLIADEAYLPIALDDDYDYIKDETLEIMLEIFQLHEDSKFYAVAAAGQEIIDVVQLSWVLQPKVLLVLGQGLRSLGFNATGGEIIEATLKVLNNMDAKDATVVLADAAEDIVELVKENFSGKIIQFAADKAISLPSVQWSLRVEHLWGAVTACMELGVEEREISEAMARFCPED